MERTVSRKSARRTRQAMLKRHELKKKLEEKLKENASDFVADRIIVEDN